MFICHLNMFTIDNIDSNRRLLSLLDNVINCKTFIDALHIERIVSNNDHWREMLCAGCLVFILLFLIHIARETIRITSFEWEYRIEHKKSEFKTVFTYSEHFTLLRHLDWKSNWIHRCTARHCNGIKCFHLSFSKLFSLF